MLNFLIAQIEMLQTKLKQLVASKNAPTAAGQRLYETARGLLVPQQDVSPNDVAPDEYGCVESFEAVCFKAFGEYNGGGISTMREKAALMNGKKWVRVTSPLPGDAILCVTGEGGRNGITNGHVGIVLHDSLIASNSSRTGNWEQNYTLFDWTHRWKTLGGYPIYFFRRVTP